MGVHRRNPRGRSRRSNSHLENKSCEVFFPFYPSSPCGKPFSLYVRGFFSFYVENSLDLMSPLTKISAGTHAFAARVRSS